MRIDKKIGTRRSKGDLFSCPHQAAACLNNLKQLQLAWQLYADDHNDLICPNLSTGIPDYNARAKIVGSDSRIKVLGTLPARDLAEIRRIVQGEKWRGVFSHFSWWSTRRLPAEIRFRASSRILQITVETDGNVGVATGVKRPELLTGQRTYWNNHTYILFGDHSVYYTLPEPNPVFHVDGNAFFRPAIDDAVSLNPVPVRQQMPCSRRESVCRPRRFAGCHYHE